MRRGDQGAYREQAQSRRAVDHDIRELVPHGSQLVLHPEVGVKLSDQLRLQLGQADSGRRNPETFLGRGLHDIRHAATALSAITS